MSGIKVTSILGSIINLCLMKMACKRAGDV